MASQACAASPGDRAAARRRIPPRNGRMSLSIFPRKGKRADNVVHARSAWGRLWYAPSWITLTGIAVVLEFGMVAGSLAVATCEAASTLGGRGLATAGLGNFGSTRASLCSPDQYAESLRVSQKKVAATSAAASRAPTTRAIILR